MRGSVVDAGIMGHEDGSSSWSVTRSWYVPEELQLWSHSLS